MQPNIVVIQQPTSQYVVQANSVAEIKYKQPRELSHDEVTKALINHFDKSIAYLQQRKKQIFG